MTRVLIVFLFSMGILFAGSSTAELYKWVDAEGKVHYGDQPPQNAKLKDIKNNISSFTSVAVEGFQFDPSLITTAASGKKVVMYMTEWCGYCKQAARHFRKNNISFVQHDIEKSANAARDFKKLGGRGVPLILVGKQKMSGFNASRFDRLYEPKS